MANREFKISFSARKSHDARILRALAIDMLSNAEANIPDTVRVAEFILEYFSSKSLRIENCTTGIFDQFYEHLEQQNTSPAQANRKLQVLAELVDLCYLYGLIPPNAKVDCRKRFKQQQTQKRAPESKVIERLDLVFFDLNNDVPLGIRTLYMLLRVICNRVSEPLLMRLDCLAYPEEDVFTISIPTTKETPFHEPIEFPYHLLKSGEIESVLHECLCKQIEFAKKSQNNLKKDCRNLLFVDSSGNRLLRADTFNAHLNQLCQKYKIYNSNGQIAKVTSHDFRHYGVRERIANQVISLERTSQECNHKNMAQTLGYGAASYMDEGDRSQLVLASVLPGQHDYTENGVPPMEPIVVSKTVYKQMETLPFIWYMPGHGVCQAPGCYPRFVNCATCNHFVPDPQFKDAILQTIENLEGKVVSLKARNDAQKAIAFNERQIYAYNAMLQKIDRQEVKNEHLEI
jgi:integrase